MWDKFKAKTAAILQVASERLRNNVKKMDEKTQPKKTAAILQVASERPEENTAPHIHIWKRGVFSNGYLVKICTVPECGETVEIDHEEFNTIAA
jgi:hypothetical protein